MTVLNGLAYTVYIGSRIQLFRNNNQPYCNYINSVPRIDYSTGLQLGLQLDLQLGLFLGLQLGLVLGSDANNTNVQPNIYATESCITSNSIKTSLGLF